LGVDSLHQAIHYLQIAVVQARPETQNQIRLRLGKIYLELMYYVDEADNAQSATDCFEAVLKKSNRKEELLEASNGKSQSWWWRIAVEEQPSPKKGVEPPFLTWARSVATTYNDDALAIYYYALSLWRYHDDSNETVSWFHLTWTLLRLKCQSPPAGFHYIYSQYFWIVHVMNSWDGEDFGYLPGLLSASEHIDLLAATVTLKDLYMIQRFVAISLISLCLIASISRWYGFTTVKNGEPHPSPLKIEQWNAWREGAIKTILELRGNISRRINMFCEDKRPIARDAAVKSEADLRAQLEARIVRPQNFP
jgi:hypothetical protein